MFAAEVPVALTSTEPGIVQQQVELEGGAVAGHGHCQAEEQVCDREVEEGQSEQEQEHYLLIKLLIKFMSNCRW